MEIFQGAVEILKFSKDSLTVRTANGNQYILNVEVGALGSNLPRYLASGYGKDAMAPKSRSAKKPETVTKTPKANIANAAHTKSAPNWPPIAPLIPAEDLALVTLLKDQILTIPQFWPTSLCRSYVSFLSTLSFATTPNKPKRGEAVRVNDRFQIDDASFARLLWEKTALKQMVLNPIIDGNELTSEERDELWDGVVLGLNPNIRIYRYSKGQFFDQHCK